MKVKKEVSIKIDKMSKDFIKKMKNTRNDISIEIDKLTNSIENATTGESFHTLFTKVKAKEIKKIDWLFDWHLELKNKNYEVYKMTKIENEDVIHGLVSLESREDYLRVSLVENAQFNRGKEKMYLGVGGNLFAFACKVSKELGYDGFIGFEAKTKLIKHYQDTLGAEIALGHRMFISNINANRLINQYFNKK